MAPEQFRGHPRPASDQYALAIVVYEWLCGYPPFTEGNFIQLGYQHTHEAPPPLRTRTSGLSPAVEQVVLKALAKDSHERFVSVQEFATALEKACKPKIVTEPPPTTRDSRCPSCTSIVQRDAAFCPKCGTPLPSLTPPEVGPGPPPSPTFPSPSQRAVAGLSYMFVGWISGFIVMFFVKKQNRFVRFHAMQSILFSSSATVLLIVFMLLLSSHTIPLSISDLIGGWLYLAYTIGWIVLMFCGFLGKYFKLPLISSYAERYANRGTR